MHLSEIKLRDWKIYSSAVFKFPAPSSRYKKNIILIGAPNGWGKTSLFEAVVLGMFGQQGLAFIPRAPIFSEGEAKMARPYKEFLENAIHHDAIKDGRYVCSVKLVFEDDEGEPIEMRRIWHFTDSGTCRTADEEVHIYEGAARTPVEPGFAYGTGRAERYGDYIAENLLPFTLANFFMFDGEQISALAKREMSAQVRAGIEGMLGIPILRRLETNLNKYAANRLKGSPRNVLKTIRKLEVDRESLENDLVKNRKRIEAIEPRFEKMKQEREEIIRDFTSLGIGSSQADMQELFEKIKNHELVISQNRASLENLLMKDIALALTGHTLRERLKDRLVSEEVRERWENAKNQGDNNLDRFLEAVEAGLGNINPVLTDSQRDDVVEIAQSAWHKLWFPPPPNCADGYLHLYLSGTERANTIGQLEELNALGATDIVNLLDQISIHEGELKSLRAEVERIEGIAPSVDKMRERLSMLNTEIEKLGQEFNTLARERLALEGEVDQKKADWAQMTGMFNEAKPARRRADSAKKVAAMVGDIVKRAVPSQITAIADAMTNAYCSITHKKGLVETIEISEACEVKLLNSQGMDVRRYDLSAGEKQVFTQSLIFAVSSIFGRSFPMIVDTPLGRLDFEHRMGVLKHLVKRGHQVILLSTDTEVVGEFLREIEPHVQKKYMIQFENVGNVGRSTARIGYFEDMEATA